MSGKNTSNQPNQAVEPTIIAVTDRAPSSTLAPAMIAAHFKRSQKTMQHILAFLVVFAAIPALAQDIEYSKKEIKKHDGSISTEIIYGHRKDQKVYERWTLFDTVSTKNPKPDTIEKFYYGPSIPFEIQYHAGTRKLIFRSLDSISVVANLEADETSERSIAFIDAKGTKTVCWGIDENGFYSKPIMESIKP